MTLPTTTLITGGSGGIGLQMSRLLAARGHRLVLASRDAGRLQAAADELHRAHGAEVHVHAIDLSEPGAAQRLFEHTQHQGLRIDALVNNAGFGIVEEHVAIDAAQLQRMLQVFARLNCRRSAIHSTTRRACDHKQNYQIKIK